MSQVQQVAPGSGQQAQRARSEHHPQHSLSLQQRDEAACPASPTAAPMNAAPMNAGREVQA